MTNINNYRLTLVIASTLLQSPFAYAGLFGPSDYDECILESMKGVKSDLAARAIIRSCREKFPKQSHKGTSLPKHAIQNLSGRAGVNFQNNFTGHIYNGNKDWIITQITVRLTPKGKEKSAEAFLKAKDYNEIVTIPPLTSKDIYIEVNAPEGEEYSWYIVEAEGYKQK